MKIISFGSCLSRYTANNYVKIFGGTLTSSTYHNRSDYFYHKFIKKNWDSYLFDELYENIFSDYEEMTENNSIIILKNQFECGLGRHMLSKSNGLFQSLSDKPDIIIIDNHMDLSGRLMHLGNRKEGIFLRESDFLDIGDWAMGDLLTPKEAVFYMNKIVRFFKEKAPLAKIFFISFPYNTYKDKIRENRHKKYSELMLSLDVEVIPCMNVHKDFMTKESQHFKPAQYCAYAGMIHSSLNKKSWKENIINRFNKKHKV